MDMRLIRGVVFLGLVPAALAGSAAPSQAYDRNPVRVPGLVPDQWGQSISNAEHQLRVRFPGVDADYCVGAIMVGHESESSFVHGVTRYWDKLACAGITDRGAKFTLIFDAKGASPNSWTIYRVSGVSVSALYG